MIVSKTFSELNNQELYQILRLRSEVFVVEQDCVYQDLDNKDQISIHIFQKKKNEIVAYTRIFKSGDYYKNPSIGRVVVSKKNRGKELGKKIMIYSIEFIKKNIKGEKIELSAQKYLDKFYKELGFYKKGEDYLEDGIPHQRMIKEIN
jgi:ElaA protein